MAKPRAHAGLLGRHTLWMRSNCVQVIVPKARNEILGVVIVESGWGSMLPTVVIANLAPAGAAARCGQLNIGDQIIAINGISLVGLPLSTCQTYIKVKAQFDTFYSRSSSHLQMSL